MDFLTLLRCPTCQESMRKDGDLLICNGCAERFGFEGGVADFVAGRLGTALDDIDYDTFYGVSQKNADELRHGFISALGSYWPLSFSPAIEIGAGTGYLTMALLQHEPEIALVVTDVSPKMLQLCRERLSSIIPGSEDKTFFATYSGEEDFAKPGAFEVCFGSSVLHHILDVPAFLKHAQRILTADGVAFFLEPNLDYHVVLSESLAEAVAQLNSQGIDENDINIVIAANWICEVQQNISHLGDLEFLAGREDKHMFSRASIATLCEDAGFSHWDAFPYAYGTPARRDLEGLLRHIGVSRAMVDRIASLAWPIAERYLAKMAPRDRCQSYVIYFSKMLPADGAPPTQFSEIKKQIFLSITMRENDGSITCEISGWALASKPIAYLKAMAGDASVKMPLTQPRLDVQRHVNGTGEFPVTYALCSGFSGSIIFQSAPDRVELRFDLVAADGGESEIAIVPVEPPFGETRHLDIE